MAKQLNLLSFFGKRPNVAIINKREQHIVRNTLDDILSQVEKNVDADKISTRKRNANNNINDLIMTNEKIKIWQKEFTFWDTEDGKVIINSHLNFYSFINFFSHEECLEISCCFLFLFSLYKLKVGYFFFFTDFFFFDISNCIFLICTSWLEINEDEQSFTCWICRLHPKIANEKNAVFKGCNKWHRNYLLRHCD